MQFLKFIFKVKLDAELSLISHGPSKYKANLGAKFGVNLPDQSRTFKVQSKPWCQVWSESAWSVTDLQSTKQTLVPSLEWICLISHGPFKVQSKPWCQVWSESAWSVTDPSKYKANLGAKFGVNLPDQSRTLQSTKQTLVPNLEWICLISHGPFKVQSKPWCQVWSESAWSVTDPSKYKANLGAKFGVNLPDQSRTLQSTKQTLVPSLEWICLISHGPFKVQSKPWCQVWSESAWSVTDPSKYKANLGAKFGVNLPDQSRTLQSTKQTLVPSLEWICLCLITDLNTQHIKRSRVHQPPLWKCFFLFLTMIFLFSNSGLGNGTSGFSWKHTLQSVRHYSQSYITVRLTLQSYITVNHTLQSYITVIHYSQPYITATHYNWSGVTICHTLQSVMHDSHTLQSAVHYSQSYITGITVSHTLQTLQSVMHDSHTLQSAVHYSQSYITGITVSHTLQTLQSVTHYRHYSQSHITNITVIHYSNTLQLVRCHKQTYITVSLTSQSVMHYSQSYITVSQSVIHYSHTLVIHYSQTLQSVITVSQTLQPYTHITTG